MIPLKLMRFFAMQSSFRYFVFVLTQFVYFVSFNSLCFQFYLNKRRENARSTNNYCIQSKNRRDDVNYSKFFHLTKQMKRNNFLFFYSVYSYIMLWSFCFLFFSIYFSFASLFGRMTSKNNHLDSCDDDDSRSLFK